MAQRTETVGTITAAAAALTTKTAVAGITMLLDSTPAGVMVVAGTPLAVKVRPSTGRQTRSLWLCRHPPGRVDSGHKAAHGDS